jgi:hypothetical protein
MYRVFVNSMACNRVCVSCVMFWQCSVTELQVVGPTLEFHAWFPRLPITGSSLRTRRQDDNCHVEICERPYCFSKRLQQVKSWGFM